MIVLSPIVGYDTPRSTRNNFFRCEPLYPVQQSLVPTVEAIAVKDVLTLILAGGKGTQLEPLTRDRTKPAVPFGGLYRIIDFPLSNGINSGLRQVLVLTQYKARSLDRHITAGWNFLSRELTTFEYPYPSFAVFRLL